MIKDSNVLIPVYKYFVRIKLWRMSRKLFRKLVVRNEGVICNTEYWFILNVWKIEVSSCIERHLLHYIPAGHSENNDKKPLLGEFSEWWGRKTRIFLEYLVETFFFRLLIFCWSKTHCNKSFYTILCIKCVFSSMCLGYKRNFKLWTILKRGRMRKNVLYNSVHKERLFMHVTWV